MIPILFANDETDFSTNGIGRLECLSCKVTEERNGIYELEAVIPVDGNHAADVAMDSILGVIPHDGGTIQGFRVYEITKPLNGKFEVYARHISYQLLNIPTMPPISIAADTTACASTLAALKTNAVSECPFTFWTNVTTVASYNQTVPAAIRTRLLGIEGSVLDQFGGEYEWDNWTVKLYKQRGTLAVNNGITLRYGKNITDIEQEENITNVITGVVPYWADMDGNIVMLPNKEVVYSSYADRYPFKRIEVLNLSDKWDSTPTVADLRSAAQAYVNNSNIALPKVSIEVSFVPVWQSVEYMDLLPLQRVKLCDEITVIFEKFGIERTAKVVKTVYDVIKERYEKIEVGTIKSGFASAINDQNAGMMQEIKVASSSAINNATKWLTQIGGYVMAIKNNDGAWAALAFSSSPNPYDSNAKVLLINENGMGFSSHGLNGNFGQSWTLDGVLNIGGNDNANGVLRILNANGQQIGKWDKDGISASAGSFSGSISGSTISGSNIYGSTIQFGSGDNYARMYWNPNVGSGRGALYIEAYNNPSYTDQITIKADLLYILAELWTEHNLHIGYQNQSANLYVNGNIYLNADRGLTAPQIWDSSHSGLIFFSFHQNPYYDPITRPSGNPQSKGWYEYSNGQYVLTTDTRVQSGKTYYQYISGGDEHVNFYLSGTSAVVLSHDPTGKQVVWSNASDIRLKENIKDIESDLTREFFDKIKPVSFNFKRDKDHTHFGLIAQELEEVLKDMGLDTEIVGEVQNEQRTKFIDYPALTGLCLKAIKDLYSEIDSLKQQLKER